MSEAEQEAAPKLDATLRKYDSRWELISVAISFSFYSNPALSMIHLSIPNNLYTILIIRPFFLSYLMLIYAELGLTNIIRLKE